MPSLAIVAANEVPGHPVAPRVDALRRVGWRVKVSDRVPRRVDVLHAGPGVAAELLRASAHVLLDFETGAALEDTDSFRAADSVLVESEGLRGLAATLGLNASVVPPVTEGRVVMAPGRDGLRLVTLAPLTWVEGHEDALQAVRLLIDRGVRCSYRIAGTGRFLDLVEFARYQLGLEGLVEIGAVDPEGAVYVSAAVAPSSPVGALDAMRAGLPVVATEPNGPALVVRRREPGELADALERLAHDPALCARLGEDGRAHAAAFGIDAQVRRYVQLYSAAARVRSAASSSTVQSSASEERRATKLS